VAFLDEDLRCHCLKERSQTAFEELLELLYKLRLLGGEILFEILKVVVAGQGKRKQLDFFVDLALKGSYS